MDNRGGGLRALFGLRHAHREDVAPAALEEAPNQVVAFAPDCIIDGTIVPSTPRLADQLAGIETLEIQHLTAEGLDDGVRREVDAFVVETDDLCAIVPPPAVGDPRRYIRTHAQLVQVEAGPYVVLGWAHAPISADPTDVHAWRPFKALTGVRIAWRLADAVVERSFAVILVNRHHVRHLEVVADERRALDPRPGPAAASDATASALGAGPEDGDALADQPSRMDGSSASERIS